MKKGILFVLVAVLCAIGVKAETFEDWVSDNHGIHGIASHKTYEFTAEVGNVLSFDWYVSSESGCDWLSITLDGLQLISESGEHNGSEEFIIGVTGKHTLYVEYSKDSSVNSNLDEAGISNIKLSSDVADFIDGFLFKTDKTLYEARIVATNLTGDISVPSTVTIDGIIFNVNSIGQGAFMGNSDITSIILPYSVTTIYDQAFVGCSNLTKV